MVVVVDKVGADIVGTVVVAAVELADGIVVDYFVETDNFGLDLVHYSDLGFVCYNTFVLAVAFGLVCNN